MKVFFDDSKDFKTDLEKLIEPLNRFNAPLVVLPTDKDVRMASETYENVTFITYDYWLSKKWIVDGDYDHIDFFRIDQFFMSRCYGVQVGVGTMRRMVSKKNNEVKEEGNDVE